MLNIVDRKYKYDTYERSVSSLDIILFFFYTKFSKKWFFNILVTNCLYLDYYQYIYEKKNDRKAKNRKEKSLQIEYK